MIPTRIFFCLFCLSISVQLLLNTRGAQAQVVIKDRIDVAPVKKQLASQATTTYVTPTSGLVRITYTWAERSIASSWVKLDETIHTLENRSFHLHTPTETFSDALEDKLGYDLYDQYHYSDLGDWSSQNCIDGWSDNPHSLAEEYQVRVSQYIPVPEKDETTIIGFVDANTELSFEFGIESSLVQPTTQYEVSSDSANWSYFIQYIAPPHIPDGAPGNSQIPSSEWCPYGYLTGTAVNDHFPIARYSDVYKVYVGTVPLEYEIIPEADTLYVADATKLQLRDLSEEATDPNELLTLSLSDPSLGHFALVDIDENGFEFTVDSSSVLTDIPFKDLDSLDTNSDRYVAFVARPIGEGANKQGNISVSNSSSDSTNTIQIFAAFSDTPEDIVGYGKVEVRAPRVEILRADSTTANHLRIAKWENAYDDPFGNPPMVINDGDENSFIQKDTARFIIKVTDPSRNTSDVVQDFINVNIETLTPDSTEDASHSIRLGERIGEEDSGVFYSPPQLLVSQDVTTLPDDLLTANNGMAIFMNAGEPGEEVMDNASTDPTHKAQVGGLVKVSYNDVTTSASVCDPDEIRQVNLRFTIFEEPYMDTGFENSSGQEIMGVAGEFDWEGKDTSIPFEDAYAAYLANPNVPSEAYLNTSVPRSQRGEKTTEFGELDENDFKSGMDQEPGASWGAVFHEDELESLITQTKIAWAQACLVIDVVSISPRVKPPKTVMETAFFFLTGGLTLLSMSLMCLKLPMILK